MAEKFIHNRPFETTRFSSLGGKLFFSSPQGIEDIDYNVNKGWKNYQKTDLIGLVQIRGMVPKIDTGWYGFDSYTKTKIHGINFCMPQELNHILVEIEKSAAMVELEPGWDDEDALPISLDTWKKAVEFLSMHAKNIYNSYNCVIKEPDIAPVRDGSIDLTWRTEKVRLLVNVKNSPKAIASYYGDFYSDENCFRGTIPIDKLHDIFSSWLKVVRI